MELVEEPLEVPPGLVRTSILIQRQFTGFADTAHGGYVCGLVAREVGNPATVNLRSAPPVERLLTLRRNGASVECLDGEVLIASGTPGAIELPAPPRVTPAEAQAGMSHYPGFDVHLFPCFVCSPKRPEGEGLHVFTGPVPGREVVASVWTAHASLAGADGYLPSELVWAALDCPSAWALMVYADPASTERVVTAQIAAGLTRPVTAGVPYIVTGWRIGTEGRRYYAGAAVTSVDGAVHAVARAVWVSVTGWGIPLGRRWWGPAGGAGDGICVGVP